MHVLSNDRHTAMSTGEKNRVPDLGFHLIDLGICSVKYFTVDLGTLNTFDGTDPKVDSVKPKVRNFFSLWRRTAVS